MNTFKSELLKDYYADLVKACKDSSKAVYITNDGTPELVAMDVDSFKKREEELIAQGLVLESYAKHLNDGRVCTTQEVFDLID